MSTAPRTDSALGYAGFRMTADEYLSLGETPDRYELIDGIVVMSPSPTPMHQKIGYWLGVQIGSTLESQPGAEVLPDTDLVLGAGLVYRPDLSCYGPGRLPRVPPRLTTPPDLVVEVLSPSNRAMDLVKKRDDYDRFGVGEYWVVDPADGRLRCWTRQGGRLIEASPAGDALECASIPGVRVDLSVLRRMAAAAR